MRRRSWFLLVLAVVIFSVAGLAYYLFPIVLTEIDWLVSEETERPEVAPEDVAVELPSDLDLDYQLPEDLRERLEVSRRQQQAYFEQARAAHEAGRLAEAERIYQRVLGTSGLDRFAALAYRYLGDIQTAREQFERAIQLYDYSLDVIDTFPETYYRRALTLEEIGQSQPALEDLNLAIQLAPEPLFLFARGNWYLGRGSFSEAIEDYTRGLGKDQFTTEFYFNRAMAYYRQGRRESALDDFSRVVEISGDSSVNYQAHKARAQIFLDQDNLSAAENELRQARQQQMTPLVLYNLSLVLSAQNNYQEALDNIEQALPLEITRPDILSSGQIYMQLGYLYEQTGRYAKAVDAYLEANNYFPEEHKILFAVGRLYEQLDNHSMALNYYRQILEDEDPEEFYQQLIYRRVGEIWLEREQPARARPAFRNVLELNPTEDEAHYNLGVAYFRENIFDRAITAFSDAVRLFPESEIYRYDLARALFLHGERAQAREQFQTVLSYHENHIDAQKMLSFIEYNWGMMDSAARGFKLSLEASLDEQETAWMLLQLGNIAMYKNDFTEAMAYYQEVIETYQLPEAYYNLGLCFLVQEKWDRALSVFELALEKGLETDKIRQGLGYLFFNRGLYQTAQGQFERAAELAPADLRAQYNLYRINRWMEELNDD